MRYVVTSRYVRIPGLRAHTRAHGFSPRKNVCVKVRSTENMSCLHIVISMNRESNIRPEKNTYSSLEGIPERARISGNPRMQEKWRESRCGMDEAC